MTQYAGSRHRLVFAAIVTLLIGLSVGAFFVFQKPALLTKRAEIQLKGLAR